MASLPKDPTTEVKLVIDAGLASTDGQVLKESFVRHFRTQVVQRLWRIACPASR